MARTVQDASLGIPTLTSYLRRRCDMEEPLQLTRDEVVEAVCARLTDAQRSVYMAILDLSTHERMSFQKVFRVFRHIDSAELHYCHCVDPGREIILCTIHLRGVVPSWHGTTPLCLLDCQGYDTTLDHKLWDAMERRWAHVEWAGHAVARLVHVATEVGLSVGTVTAILSPCYRGVTRIEPMISQRMRRRVEDIVGGEFIEQLDHALVEAVQLVPGAHQPAVMWHYDNFHHAMKKS